MILKDTDAKSVHLVELASLLSNPGVPADKQALIDRELKFMRAGMKGDSEVLCEHNQLKRHARKTGVI